MSTAQPQPIIVAIYCRSATDDEETQTKLDQQEAACRAYCAEHGLIVGVVYREVASGSIYRERPQLGQMRARFCTNEIQGVVVSRLDRLSRSHIHFILLLQEMEACRTTLYCALENLSDDPAGRFALMILNILSDVEREKALDTPPTEASL